MDIYLLPYFVLGVARPLDYHPELYELFLRDFSIIIKIDSIKELICGYLAKSHLRPMFLRLGPINRLAAVLIKDLENFPNQLCQVMGQLL